MRNLFDGCPSRSSALSLCSGSADLDPQWEEHNFVSDVPLVKVSGDLSHSIVMGSYLVHVLGPKILLARGMDRATTPYNAIANCRKRKLNGSFSLQ